MRIIPVMPPLLDEEKVEGTTDYGNNDTLYSGGACEKIVEAYLLRNRINFSEPFIDDGLDILVDEPGLRKGQVKKVIYKNKLDKGMLKRGKTVYRDIYDFRFQSTGEVKHPRNKENTDVFYEVLLTCYRTLIFKVPAKDMTTLDNGNFPKMKNVVLDRDSIIRRKQEGVDLRKCLVDAQYDPIIFQTFPDFFAVKPTVFV